MALPIEDLTQSLPRKKARIEGKTNNLVQEKSDARQHSLFAPFRALGLVTNHVPFALQTRTFKGASDGLKTHILTCLGRSWALWEGSQMTLLFAGA
jgi:U3 small nucleolar RNA-associated protein 21